jgi:outer membrane protein OmpA-like peptidoglycan-associated protein
VLEERELAFPATFGVDGDRPEIAPADLASFVRSITACESAMVVTGHTCDMGSAAHNVDLGLRRAKAVAARLAREGVEEARLRAESAGSSRPLVPNVDERARRRNRRVAITCRVPAAKTETVPE